MCDCKQEGKLEEAGGCWGGGEKRRIPCVWYAKGREVELYILVTYIYIYIYIITFIPL